MYPALPWSMSTSIKIKVGSLLLTETRDEDIPQEFAAWHQTVRVAPGTYPVFAYLDPRHDGSYRIHQLSAECAGITVSSNFRAHLMGHWGKSDNNCNGQPATVHIGLPRYGLVNAVEPSLLAQATLYDALVREEWDPRESDPSSTSGKMWSFTWNPAHRPIIIERPRHGGGGLSLAAFEDSRRFHINGVERTPAEIRGLDIGFENSFLRSIDQIYVGETVKGFYWDSKQRCEITRLA